MRASLGLLIAVGGLLATGWRETPKAAARPPQPVQVTQVIQLYSIDHLPREGKGRRGQPIPRSLHLNVKRTESHGVNGRAPSWWQLTTSRTVAANGASTWHKTGTRRGTRIQG
jgi:hypothetical protein